MSETVNLLQHIHSVWYQGAQGHYYSFMTVDWNLVFFQIPVGQNFLALLSRTFYWISSSIYCYIWLSCLIGRRWGQCFFPGAKIWTYATLVSR